MIAVGCPSCTKPMQIEETQANVEWECPACGTAFLAQHSDAGLQLAVTQAAAAQPEEPGIADEAYVYAVDSLGKGIKPREVRKGLLEAGYSPRQADQIMQGAVQYRKDNELRDKITLGGADAGRRNMMIGGAICLIGIVVTLATLTLASDSGGGRFIIAWGAIIGGGIQFFRGYSQSQQ